MAGLPLPPAPVANGEFVPGPPGPLHEAMGHQIRATVDAAARAAGLDRRRFLQTAGGVAASLAVFDLAAACSPGRSQASPPAGHFNLPTTTDLPACEHALGSQGEFIVDVHTHHVMPDAPWRRTAPDTVGLIEAMLPGGCHAADPLQCVNQANYLHDVFLASDTTVAMLTDVPNSGPDNAPLPLPAAVNTEQLVAQLAHGGANRLLVNNVIAPNVGALGAHLEAMTAAVSRGHLASFKVYTAWNPAGPGFSLEDPAIGLPVIQHAHDLGVKVFVAHKGLPLVHFDPAHNGAEDIVAVSRQFPDMQFVVFHAGWDPRHREGPFNPRATIGVDAFLAALDRHHVAANDNVWVDLGTVWRQLLTDPDQAAHLLGKLLTRVGQDRVLWGTDAIWYGGPQPQIMAMRAFQINVEHQDRFGYPALTDELKAKIFGLNAARLFGLDPHATRCALASDPLTAAQPQAASLRREGAIPSPWTPKGPTTRRQMLAWLASPLTRWTPL